MKPDRRKLLYTGTAIAAALVGLRACSGLMGSMAPSADVLARADENRPEFSVARFPQGEATLLMLKSNPVYVWHRNDAQRALAIEQNYQDTNRDRYARFPGNPSTWIADEKWLTIDSRWIAFWGVCTRDLCVLQPQVGDFGGFFCPCCAAHYDLAGRIRKGIAPYNMRVIPMRIVDGGASVRLHLKGAFDSSFV